MGIATAKRLKTGKGSNFQKGKQHTSVSQNKEPDVYLVQRFSHQETLGYTHSTYYTLKQSSPTNLTSFFDCKRYGRQGVFYFSEVHHKLPHANPWDKLEKYSRQ